MKAKIRFAKIRSTQADHDNKLAIELMNDQGNMIADITISTEDFARIVFTGGEIPAEIIRGWSANLAWYLAQYDLTQKPQTVPYSEETKREIKKYAAAELEAKQREARN